MIDNKVIVKISGYSPKIISKVYNIFLNNQIESIFKIDNKTKFINSNGDCSNYITPMTEFLTPFEFIEKYESNLINSEQIKGMLLVLNKLYFKVPKETARYMVAEASDMPGLGGYFYFNKLKEEIVFKPFKK